MFICTGSTLGNLGEANGGAGSSDIFILKVAKISGDIKYIFQLGENSELVEGSTDFDDFATGIEVDENGIYLAGGTVGDLGATNLADIGNLNIGSDDAFVMKIREGIGGNETVAGPKCSGVDHTIK